MNSRQHQLLDRLIAVRGFLIQFADILADIVPPGILVQIERLIVSMQNVAATQGKRTPNQLRVLRNRLRRESPLDLYVDQILSAARASGLVTDFRRYRAPRRFANRRLVIFTESLLARAGASVNALHLPEGFLKRAHEHVSRYQTTLSQTKLATTRAPIQAELAAAYESQARAVIAHVHTLIAPYIDGLDAQLAWREIKILPSHHGPSTLRLASAEGPKGLLPSGPPVNESASSPEGDVEDATVEWTEDSPSAGETGEAQG